MGAKKRKRLDAVVAAIRRRWGTNALRQGGRRPATIPAISTSFAALDGALAGLGGIPRGRITEILGAPTSGMATLALKIISQAQGEGHSAAYIDLGATFDPDYAARCGVALSQLLLVRPRRGIEALEISLTLARQRGLGVLLFDSVAELLTEPDPATLAANLNQLPAVLSRSGCAAIFLTPLPTGQAMAATNYPPGLALPAYATVRLLLSKERWLHRHGDIRGYQARVQVLKNKLGRAGHSANITITFNGTVQGDST